MGVQANPGCCDITYELQPLATLTVNPVNDNPFTRALLKQVLSMTNTIQFLWISPTLSGDAVMDLRRSFTRRDSTPSPYQGYIHLSFVQEYRALDFPDAEMNRGP